MAESKLLRTKALQNEASEVADELRLHELLSQAGEPVRVVSPRVDGMERPGHDGKMYSAESTINSTNRIGTYARAGVRELKFINDTGVYNMDPAYPDGLYIGLKYKSQQGKEWKMDIWFVDEPERQPDLKHIITMPER